VAPVRKLIAVLVVIVGVFAWSWLGPKPAKSAVQATVFPLKVDGKSWQPAIVGIPGKAIGTGPVKDKKTAEILQGILPDFATAYLDLDPSGKFYLFYDSQTSWRAATNPNGDDATTLTGQISNDGQVWMFGTYQLPMGAGTADIFVTGKVKYEKAGVGIYIPKSVKGQVFFSSAAINTGMNLKFKTLPPLV
jgi:hypothetical protein